MCDESLLAGRQNVAAQPSREGRPVGPVVQYAALSHCEPNNSNISIATSAKNAKSEDCTGTASSGAATTTGLQTQQELQQFIYSGQSNAIPVFSQISTHNVSSIVHEHGPTQLSGRLGFGSAGTISGTDNSGIISRGGVSVIAPDNVIPRVIAISPAVVSTQASQQQKHHLQLHSHPYNNHQQSNQRLSVTNQCIVNALTGTRPRNEKSPARAQLFPDGTNVTRAPSLKRPFALTSMAQSSGSGVQGPAKRTETYLAKNQRVMNHRNVRSKILREKYNESLLENYHLSEGGIILDLHQFAKRPKTQQLLQFLSERAIDSDASNRVTPIAEVIAVPPPITQPTDVASKPSSQDQSSSHDNLLINSAFEGIKGQSVSIDVGGQDKYEAAETFCGKSKSTTSDSTTPMNEPLSNAITTQPLGAVNQRPGTTTPNIPNTVSTPSSSRSRAGYPENIVEKAKQEAYVVQRISELQKDGMWPERRLPKVQEMPRTKAHWDFLLEEMVWLAADFAQERKWKKAAAKKCARMVQKYFQDKALAAQRAEKAHEQNIRRIAAFCAKEIRNFWSNVEKLVEYKQNTRLEEKRKKALDQQLSFMVDQTEKYSQLLAEGMNKTTSVKNANKTLSAASSNQVTPAQSDGEFEPEHDASTDDEETIAKEEEHDSNEKTSEEVQALQRESEMDFESFLSELPKDYLEKRFQIQLSSNEDDSNENKCSRINDSDKDCDEDFAVGSDTDADSADDENTINEQEVAEGATAETHAAELKDLNDDAEMSIDELRSKYSSNPIFEDEDESSNECSDASSDKLADESDDSNITGSEDDEMDCQDLGLRSLIEDKTTNSDGNAHMDDKNNEKNDLLNDAAAIAESIQPKGNTLNTTCVVTKVPFLLKLTLREYQHIGLDWLVTMFERKLNGILADEMGLGKTIQTIALLAHLACEKENWGPHLIVVPTSVMLNWEMECKKWCPGFKILTYYGSQKERKQKRTGWTKANAFHICITSYKLVIQDHQSFRRKKWKYLILDEAQNIKNFKSQRWQLLLNFQTQQRLLLTGTPLQNNLMELWSLMHFLMPNVFQSHREFKEWFSNPVSGMIEGNSEYNESIIKRLHKVLRPFLLRRLKCEVEKQMPKKYEHVVMCRLARRQRYLYDDYMSRAKTRETLAGGNLLSVINVLMQLRKVCNHPNLFEARPTVSPFHCEGVQYHIPSLVYGALEHFGVKAQDLLTPHFKLLDMEFMYGAYECYRLRHCHAPRRLIEEVCTANSNISSARDMSSLPKVMPYVPSIPMHVDRHLGTRQKTPTDPSGGPSCSNQAVGAVRNVRIKTTGLANNDQLKPEGFAQLVETSTGRHILLTPKSANISNLNGSATVTTSSGQNLTLLSKKPVPTSMMSVSKTIIKLPIAEPGSEAKTHDIEVDSRQAVGIKYIQKLFHHQPPIHRIPDKQQREVLDVRWVGRSEEALRDDEEEYFLHADHHYSEPVDAQEVLSRKIDLIDRINKQRCSTSPIFGKDLLHFMTSLMSVYDRPDRENTLAAADQHPKRWSAGYVHCHNLHHKINVDFTTNFLLNCVRSTDDYVDDLEETFQRFIICVPAVHASRPKLRVWHPTPSMYWGVQRDERLLCEKMKRCVAPLHRIVTAMTTQFPHPRLIQYDCGKLQTLDLLLRQLKQGGHRVLIFTQMTKMLDVLEAFLNFHGHIYLRLDGTTRVDTRQILMERFNADKRIFVFILSTRSGGVGVNLTGADTVIFYDSDWNPTMDAQAQDRCHRIGQTRDVHIYRLVSERTIEENILKKANQKRILGDLAIEGGNFTTAFFKSSTIQDLFNVDQSENAADRMVDIIEQQKQRESILAANDNNDDSTEIPTSEEKSAMGALESALAAAEDEQDVAAARTAKAEAVADLAEFDENIPLDDRENNGTAAENVPEISKAEQEVENIVKQLTPIERYAMRFIEDTETAWSKAQLEAAEREIEEQKIEWEQNRLRAMREEEERRAREQEEEERSALTFSREDAINQVWYSDNTSDPMPMWCPPTPPQQDGDVFVTDTVTSFLYDNNSVMVESQLPPVYVKREDKRPRQMKSENATGASASTHLHNHKSSADVVRRSHKVARRDDMLDVSSLSTLGASQTNSQLGLANTSGGSSYVPHNNAPRSLFDRPTTASFKVRRDMKLQKFRDTGRSLSAGGHLSGASVFSNGTACSSLSLLGNGACPSGHLSSALGVTTAVGTNNMKLFVPNKPTAELHVLHPWIVHEDMALVRAIRTLQKMPINLRTNKPGHTPNWDFIADYVNTVSVTYRSPKHCKVRYESTLMPREEGKLPLDASPKKKKAKTINTGPLAANSGIRNKQAAHLAQSAKTFTTDQLHVADNNVSFGHHMTQRFDTVKVLMPKRNQNSKNILSIHPPSLKNAKHLSIFVEAGIDLDRPVLPVEMAQRRAERVAREKKVAMFKNVPSMTPIVQHQIQSQLSASPSVTTVVASSPQTGQAQVISQGSMQHQLHQQQLLQQLHQQHQQQIVHVSTGNPVIVSSVVTTAGSSPNTLRTQRIMSTGMQPNVVSISPAHFQTTQRLIVSASGMSGVTGVVPGGKSATTLQQSQLSQQQQVSGNLSATGVSAKITTAQLQMIRQASNLKQQQLRVAALQQQQQQQQVHTLQQPISTQIVGSAAQVTAGMKTATVSIAGQQTVQVQFNQAQARSQMAPRVQYIKSSTGTLVPGKQAGTARTITDTEMAQLLSRRQIHLQQQKVLAAAAGGSALQQQTGIQGISPHALAQAIQVGSGASGQQITTLLKTVPNTAGISLSGSPNKQNLVAGLKTTAAQQRQMHQLQLIAAQKKLAAVSVVSSQAVGGSTVVGNPIATTATVAGNSVAKITNLTQVSTSALSSGMKTAHHTVMGGTGCGPSSSTVSTGSITGLLSSNANGGNAAAGVQQLIMGTKPLGGSTPITMQQFHQAVAARQPLQVPASGGSVVIAKGNNPRVIPISTVSGNKSTIQVVTANPQGLQTTLRHSVGVSGNLSGLMSPAPGGAATIKVQTVGALSGQHQALHSAHGPASLQNQSTGAVIRQATVSPMRLQAIPGGQPLVAVTLQSSSVSTVPTCSSGNTIGSSVSAVQTQTTSGLSSSSDKDTASGSRFSKN